MHITELRLKSADLQGQYALFIEQFGCDCAERSPDRLVVRIGTTRLVFERAEPPTNPYHYALGVPEQRFADAVHWLEQRVALLADQHGQQTFFFEAWNAHAVYFRDADGNIGELIARHHLKSPFAGAFAASGLLGVREIGLVVDDVPATVAHLEQQYGLRPYQAQRHPEFTAVGDEDGMFIVVQTNRPWLPTGEPAQRSWSATTFKVNDGDGVYAHV